MQISAAEPEELLVEKQTQGEREREAIVQLSVFVSDRTTG